MRCQLFNPEQVGFQLVFALGVFGTYEIVVACGILVTSSDEVEIGGGHDGVVGQGSCGVVHADNVVGLESITDCVDPGAGIVGQINR